MAVARIRTSDPEVIEFLSRQLAASGYQLEFVRPGEPVHGEADLEIDATRMDLASAMAQAQQEGGLVTVLQGVLRAEPQSRQEEMPQPVQDFREYADVSPYARGAELEDEPSKFQKAASATGNVLASGLNALGEMSKATSSRFGAWKAQREVARAARREQRERDLAVAAARRREEQARRAEEESRRLAEEERQAAIRREEMLRMQAEERVRREEQARIQAEVAQRKAEEDRRLQAEAAQRRVEEEARRQAEQERRRAEELAASGIERQRQEELRFAQAQQPQVEEQSTREEDLRRHHESEERQRAAAASREESFADSEAATVEDSIAEPHWEQAQVPEPPKIQAPYVPRDWNRPASKPRISRHRERVFRRAGVAAAIVAAAIVSIWSVAALRRPANPLNNEVLLRSATVEQRKPFGPASTTAPVVRPAAKPVVRPAVRTAKKPVATKPTPRTSRTRANKTTRTGKRTSNDDGGDEVIVRHFSAPKPQPATATAKVKNGVKIISESD